MHAYALGVDALVELHVVDARERMLVLAEDFVVFILAETFAREPAAVEVVVHRLDYLVSDLVGGVGEHDVDFAFYARRHAAQQLVEAVAREYRAYDGDVALGEFARHVVGYVAQRDVVALRARDERFRDAYHVAVPYLEFVALRRSGLYYVVCDYLYNVVALRDDREAYPSRNGSNVTHRIVPFSLRFFSKPIYFSIKDGVL